MLHAVMLLAASILWLCHAATLPQLLRKHAIVSPSGDVKEDRAPTGHKYRHLDGFQAAFEEMNAIQRKAEASVELWHDAQKSLEDDCAKAGEGCRKSIELMVEPVNGQKLDYLCTQQAITCISSNMDKCHAVHERLSEIQKTWQCEAVQCSAAGHECEMTVLYLEMEDQRLTQEQRQKKTRYLCSPEAKKCISENKDVCKTAHDILSMAVDLGHCDSVRCAHAGPDCAMAVGFLSEEQMSNMTYRQAQETWSYLCGDKPFQCLEKHLDACGHFYDAVKLGYAQGRCDAARCAREGPDCALAVNYLSNPGKTYVGEELKNKTEFLCGYRGVACIMSHPTCSEVQKAAREAFESPSCPERKEPQVVRWQKQGDPLDARTDAAQAVTKQKAKEEEEEKLLVKASAGLPGENATEDEDAAQKLMTEEEKRKAGKKIFIGILAVLLAAAALAYFLWRRKKGADADASPEGPASPTPSPDGETAKPKTEFLQRVKEPFSQAASAIGEVSGASLVAQLKSFTGLGLFKKAAAEGTAESEQEPAAAAGSSAPPEADAPKEPAESREY